MRRAVRQVIEQESDLIVVGEASNGFEAAEQAAQTLPDVVLMDLNMPACDGFEATERVLIRSPHSRIVIFTASREECHVFQAIQRGAIGYITKDVEPEALLRAIRCAARNDLCIPGALASRVLAYIRAFGHTQPYVASSRQAAIVYRIPQRSNSRTTSTAQAIPAESRASVPESPTEAIVESTTGTAAIDLTTVPEQPYAMPIPTIRPLTEREREILDLMRKGRKNREIALELEIAESTVHKHVQNIFEKLHARNRAEAIYFTSIEGRCIL
jgi:DNA-binding NarL/FixJ family response regulator